MLTTGGDLARARGTTVGVQSTRGALAALAALAAFAAGCGGALDSSPGPMYRDASSDAAAAASTDASIDLFPFDVAVVIVRACGNGILEPGEACDDGNLASGDGCTVLCQLADHAICPTPGRPCTLPVTCGDGALVASEACDDGNTASGDGCAADCTTVEVGWRCPVAGRACVPLCGDGMLSPPETCDDGNTTDGDGCSSTCLVEPGCVCPPGAACGCAPCAGPDGGTTDGGGSCTVPHCGDGIVSGAEECDDSATSSASVYGGCTPTCRYSAYCGDGVVNGPEECDLGTRMNVSTYGASGCTSGCLKPHYCGDGIVDAAEGEQCDLGANNSGAGEGCSNNCKIYLP